MLKFSTSHPNIALTRLKVKVGSLMTTKARLGWVRCDFCNWIRERVRHACADGGRAHISVSLGPNREKSFVVIGKSSTQSGNRPWTDAATALSFFSFHPKSRRRRRARTSQQSSLTQATTATANGSPSAATSALHRLSASRPLPLPASPKSPWTAPPPPPWLVRGVGEKVRPDPRKGAAAVSLILSGFLCYCVMRSMYLASNCS
jgi:hypothetical protein